MTTTAIRFEPGDTVKWRGWTLYVERHDWPAGVVYLVDDEGNKVSAHEGTVYPC
jgi:hypothetical protein